MHADRPRERGPGPGWRGGDSPRTGPGNFLDARTQAKVQISGCQYPPDLGGEIRGADAPRRGAGADRPGPRCLRHPAVRVPLRQFPDTAGTTIANFAAFLQVSMLSTACVVITYLDVGSRLSANA